MNTPMKVRKTIDREFTALGSRIKQARESSNRSLIQLCAEIGMTTANWYKIENEQTKVLPLETLRKIEKVLQIDLGVELE